jgi:hypothetical protein
MTFLEEIELAAFFCFTVVFRTKKSVKVRMLVVYGSQTGTAGGIAEKLARDATRRHVPVRLFALDEFPLASLVDEQFVVFVVATTGQGLGFLCGFFFFFSSDGRNASTHCGVRQAKSPTT